MQDIKFTLPGPDIITLSGQTVNKLLRSGDGDAVLLYLYILKTEGRSSTEETMAALGKGLGWINSAMATLSRIGLIHLESGKNDNTGIDNDIYDISVDDPGTSNTNTVADMRRELEPGSDFSIVVDETQKSLGYILSPGDLMRLFGIYNDLNMPLEVILQLITYCINEGRRSRGGRAPGLKYIEKVAYEWSHENIITLERAEEYIKNLEERRSIRGEIKYALKIRDRELSATERKYVDKWIIMGFKADAVDIAYDKTIVKTGERAWPFMDKIITSWHNRGLHTVADIIEKDGGIPRPRDYIDGSTRNKLQGELNQEELNRMKRLLEKTNEN